MKLLALFAFAIVVYVSMRLAVEVYSTPNNYFFWGWMAGVFVSGCVKIMFQDD